MITTINDAEICQCGDTLAQSLWPKTVQLFLREDHPDGRPRPLGSGVVARAEYGVFIFSAAHVLVEFKIKNELIWVGSGGGLVPLQGECRYHLTGSPEMGNHESDPVDAGVVLLPQDSPHDLIARALDVSEINSKTERGEGRYLLLGQPANRTDIDARRKEISSERRPLICLEVEDAVYKTMGYEKRTHLLLEWHNQWRTATGAPGARNLAGSSGGPIWRFNPHAAHGAELVGTLTEITHPRKGRRVLVATRIHVHLELAARC